MKLWICEIRKNNLLVGKMLEKNVCLLKNNSKKFVG
jgi:hypothetical protein